MSKNIHNSVRVLTYSLGTAMVVSMLVVTPAFAAKKDRGSNTVQTILQSIPTVTLQTASAATVTAGPAPSSTPVAQTTSTPAATTSQTTTPPANTNSTSSTTPTNTPTTTTTQTDTTVTETPNPPTPTVTPAPAPHPRIILPVFPVKLFQQPEQPTPIAPAETTDDATSTTTSPAPETATSTKAFVEPTPVTITSAIKAVEKAVSNAKSKIFKNKEDTATTTATSSAPIAATGIATLFTGSVVGGNVYASGRFNEGETYKLLALSLALAAAGLMLTSSNVFTRILGKVNTVITVGTEPRDARSRA